MVTLFCCSEVACYIFIILQNVYIFDFYSFLYFYIEKVIHCFEVLFDFDVLIVTMDNSLKNFEF